MPKSLDPGILRDAMAGNTKAFRVIVEEYQVFVYAVSFRFVGSASDAEDITQEAFIRLWKNMNAYRLEIKLSTWLYRIVTNLCLDFLKTRHSKQRRNMHDIAVVHSVADALTPEIELQNSELMKIIRTMADALTSKQRAVFVLRDLEGLDVSEVCEVLSMSASHVKSNLFYARKKMSEKLKSVYQTTRNPLIP